MHLFRALAFMVLAFVATALAFVTASVCLIFDPGRGRIGHFVGRLWGRALLFAAGARLVVTNAERFVPSEARVLAGNHASYLDIPAMFVAFPGQARFVARRTLIWLPFVGWYIRLGGHFSVDREDPRQALDLMTRIGEKMRRYGLSPVLFPEGTRSRDGRLGPLKPGALQMALATRATVQPFAILGSSAILPKGAWGPRHGGTIEVRVGEPIPIVDLQGSTGRKVLAERLRDALLALGVPDAASSAEPSTSNPDGNSA